MVSALSGGPQTVYALSLAIFGDLNTMDRFLAISEVLAHLEWLETCGDVTSEPQDGTLLWRKT
jgi:hypothetical protein